MTEFDDSGHEIPESEPCKLQIPDPSQSSITFHSGLGNDNKEVIRLCPNGDIYVRGRLIENDKELVDGLREWLLCAGWPSIGLSNWYASNRDHIRFALERCSGESVDSPFDVALRTMPK